MIIFGRRTDTPPDIGELRAGHTLRAQSGNHQTWTSDDPTGGKLRSRIQPDRTNISWLQGAETAPAGDGWYVSIHNRQGNTIAAIGPVADEPRELMDLLMANAEPEDGEELRERLEPLVNRAIERRIDATAATLAQVLSDPSAGDSGRRAARREVLAAADAAKRWQLATDEQ